MVFYSQSASLVYNPVVLLHGPHSRECSQTQLLFPSLDGLFEYSQRESIPSAPPVSAPLSWSVWFVLGKLFHPGPTLGCWSSHQETCFLAKSRSSGAVLMIKGPSKEDNGTTLYQITSHLVEG